MKSKVYIETSIVSYYTNRPSRYLVTAARQEITRIWWEENRNVFDVYISVLVLEEASGGDPGAAERRLEALGGIPVLGLTTEAQNLAEALIQSGSIPIQHTEDAMHIALATTHGMDFLVTWNFTHINNAILKREIAGVCEENGYECPVICSPEELSGGMS